MQVDFFIIGAPKCGTTSLVEYLSSHPDIGFSQIKEPHYFSDDFPGYQEVKDYESFMSSCFSQYENDKKLMYGEGSVFYLYSDVAIKNILAYNPEAKFIVMIRNPIDLVYSLYAQLLFTSDENIDSFDKAWELCELRRSQKKKIPRTCREPFFLQYDKMGLLAKNVERFYKLVPENQRKTIIFDDFIQNTEKVYVEVIEFLGLQNDQRKDFPRVNANAKVHSQLLNIISRHPPKFLIDCADKIKAFFGIKSLMIGSLFHYAKQINKVEEKREPMQEDLRLEIFKCFESDIKKLEKLENTDFSHWH